MVVLWLERLWQPPMHPKRCNQVRIQFRLERQPSGLVEDEHHRRQDPSQVGRGLLMLLMMGVHSSSSVETGDDDDNDMSLLLKWPIVVLGNSFR